MIRRPHPPLLFLKTIALFCIALCCTSMVQQEEATTFVIKDKANVQDLSRYIHALNKANMETYRLLNKRTVLTFEPQKVIVELLSAKELEAKGNKIDLASYQTEFPQSFEMPVFSLSTDGWLLARYSNEKSKFH